MPKGARQRSDIEQQEVAAFQLRLEQLIAARGTTPAGLARSSGTTPRTIYRILQIGAEPSRTLLVAMARALGVSVDTLATDGSQGADVIDPGYVALARKALEMAFGAAVVAAMPGDEIEALILRVADVLRALYASSVPPAHASAAVVATCRSAVCVLINDATAQYLAGPPDNASAQLNLIDRAALSLEYLFQQAANPV